MAPVDIKQRYSLYVPKPLSRINLGDWQRRDLQTPKFGYAGVSIQTEGSMFVDVTKATYIQAKGGYVAQTTDWLQCSKGAMTMATSDSATLGADGVITVAAGAGHGPTFTLDHGDSMDTYPYNPLSLHYRVEEVQNSLFEFFRGRRQKDLTSANVRKGFSWWFKRDDKIFNSSTTRFLKNPFDSLGSNPMGYDGAKEEDTTVAALKGGFERVANVSWYRLFGSDDDWDTPAPPPAPLPGAAPPPLPEIPQDLFDGMGDIRKDAHPDLLSKADIEASAGDETEDQLVFGFSAYFSRFDPYALIDPERFAKDVKKKKLSPVDAIVMKFLARVNNALVKMKRTVDVVYKIGSILSNNSLFKLVQDTAAAVDGFNGALKSFRGQYEMHIESPYITKKPGTFYDQMADEEASGHGKRADKLGKMSNWAADSTAQATVRSGAPGKDYGVFGDGATFVTGDILTIKADDGTVFTSPALNLGATAAVPAVAAVPGTAAQIQGVAATNEAWTIAAGTYVRLVFDNGIPVKVELPAQTILSAAAALAADQGLAQGAVATNVTARAAAIAALQQSIVDAVGGARAALASKSLKLTSPTTGTSSTIVLTDSPSGTLAMLGLTTAVAAGTAGVAAVAAVPAVDAKLPSKVTAKDIVALLSAATETPPSNPAKKLSDYFTVTEEGEQVVLTRVKKGHGSKVEVGGSLQSKLKFVGDARGWSDKDEIEEVDKYRRGQDDFEKAMIEVNQLPQDTANLTRPMILVWKNAAAAVKKLEGAVKSLFKIGGLKLPTNKGAIGLVANGGISLGTPDRIVGAGGLGVVFIADGGTGKPDHAKYAMLEDIVNRFTAADFVGALRELALGTPPAPTVPSLGFRVFSDTTVDLTARNTANLIALGRSDAGAGKTVGVGIARVAASYGAEMAAQSKVVIRAREKDAGRVEVLGSTLALGFNDIDVAEKRFGLDNQPGNGPRGWSDKLKAQHPTTGSVLVHSTDQACIVVGDYMVQLRSKAKTDATLSQAEADKKGAEDRLKQFRDERTALRTEKTQKQLIVLLPDRSNQQAYNDAQDRLTEIGIRRAIVDQGILDEKDNVTTFTKAVQSAQETNDEGVIISMRDPAEPKNTAASNWAWKEKPSIVLSQKGVTITTRSGDDAHDESARITLDKDGISILVKNKAGIRVKKDSIELSNGTKTVKLKDDGTLDSNAAQITFAAAQKITLG